MIIIKMVSWLKIKYYNEKKKIIKKKNVVLWRNSLKKLSTNRSNNKIKWKNFNKKIFIIIWSDSIRVFYRMFTFLFKK